MCVCGHVALRVYYPQGSLERRLGRSSASPLGRESSRSGAVHELVQLELLPDQRAHVVGGGLVSVRARVSAHGQGRGGGEGEGQYQWRSQCD